MFGLHRINFSKFRTLNVLVFDQNWESDRSLLLPLFIFPFPFTFYFHFCSRLKNITSFQCKSSLCQYYQTKPWNRNVIYATSCFQTPLLGDIWKPTMEWRDFSAVFAKKNLLIPGIWRSTESFTHKKVLSTAINVRRSFLLKIVLKYTRRGIWQHGHFLAPLATKHLHLHDISRNIKTFTVAISMQLLRQNIQPYFAPTISSRVPWRRNRQVLFLWWMWKEFCHNILPEEAQN